MSSAVYGSAGEYGGKIAGGFLGGAIGSIFGPVGTFAGRWVGSKLGGIAGRAAAEALATAMEDANTDAETKTKDVPIAETCATCQKIPKNPCEHLKKGQGEGENQGGAHEEMKGPSGDNLDSHHTPSKDSYKGKLHPDDGPAMRMPPKEHQSTGSWGSGDDAKAYRDLQKKLIEEGKWKEAFDMDVEDLKKLAEKLGDPNKFDQRIKDADAYRKCMEKHGLLPKPDTGTLPGDGPPAQPPVS